MMTDTTEIGNAIGSTEPTAEDRAHWTPEMWAQEVWEKLTFGDALFVDAVTVAIRGYAEAHGVEFGQQIYPAHHVCDCCGENPCMCGGMVTVADCYGLGPS